MPDAPTSPDRRPLLTMHLPLPAWMFVRLVDVIAEAFSDIRVTSTAAAVTVEVVR